MAYTDIESVQKFISQQQLLIWSDPARNDSVTLDKGNVETAIREAEAEINSRLAQAKYKIPVVGATVDDMADIKGIANRLTIYNLAEANILGESGTLKRLEGMFKRVQDKLTGYAAGSLTIIGAERWYGQTDAPRVVPANGIW